MFNYSRAHTDVSSFIVLKSFLDWVENTLIVLSSAHDTIQFPSDEKEQELTLRW